MATILDGDLAHEGDLAVTSPAFGDGARLPDWTGYANDNVNPPLELSGVPADAGALVVVLDDPDAEPVAGHTWDHWLVWDVDPGLASIPRDWDPTADGATVGYNDFPAHGYGGPSPPDDIHAYRFKVLALASPLGLPPETRKQRIGSAIAMETDVLGADQLVGTYDPSQGTAF